MSGGIYEGPGGRLLHGDGKPVSTPSVSASQRNESRTPWGRCNDCGAEIEKDGSFTHCAKCVRLRDEQHAALGEDAHTLSSRMGNEHAGTGLPRQGDTPLGEDVTDADVERAIVVLQASVNADPITDEDRRDPDFQELQVMVRAMLTDFLSNRTTRSGQVQDSEGATRPDLAALFQHLANKAEEARQFDPDRREAIEATVLATLRAAASGAPSPVEGAADECVWTAIEDGPYETSCGHLWEFNAGGPEENGMGYCPYCGKTLVSGQGDNAEASRG